VSGQINGLELHLGVLDAPPKGREEARRLNARNKVWDWFADDFLSRFAKDAALLVVMTRWDVDDLLGRYIARFPDVRMLNYPAIAEYDGQFRRKGDPLFPELKPLDFLMERKKLLTQPTTSTSSRWNLAASGPSRVWAVAPKTHTSRGSASFAASAVCVRQKPCAPNTTTLLRSDFVSRVVMPLAALRFRRYHVARLIPAVSHGLVRLIGLGPAARLRCRRRASRSRASRRRRSRIWSSVMQLIDLIVVIASSVRSISVRRSRQPSVEALYFSGRAAMRAANASASCCGIHGHQCAAHAMT
jgi:hypothetical protein